MADLKDLKNVSAKDRKMIEEAEIMLGPEPEDMGYFKNMFWGRVREDLIFPYPKSVSTEETARCDQLLAELDAYLRNEHPSVQIDQEEEIPRWVIDRLFEMGVLGMTIPKEFGGLGLGITSYNRILQRIGATCGSTAVLVSAHQSIGCKAIMLFGTEDQKRHWLPKLANGSLSAFCLSEPNVGCDAGGQETHCELSEDGSHYILNGEKKWATSAAISGLFTVMAKQKVVDPRTGKSRDRITALVCTPDMDGIDIYEKNRSKCGIRGTWQARIRFTNVKVPRENLLHKEGKGLNVALTCLNYGRCTLSAGMLGSANACMDQAIKWSRTRHQFERPLSDFELVKVRIAHMSALTYAMDAVLYMTTGMLDRNDEDIMLETAACKVFCSEMGWRVINDAIQVMGGESYMTENDMERAFRDCRLNLIVEGANEVMQSLIFAYGGKQLAEQMLGLLQAFGVDEKMPLGARLSRILRSAFDRTTMSRAIPLGAELFLGIKPAPTRITQLHSSLAERGDRFAKLVRDLSYQFKRASQRYQVEIITRQAIQARLADVAMSLYAMGCVLSKLDRQIRAGEDGVEFRKDKASAEHFLDLTDLSIRDDFRMLTENADVSMLKASQAAIDFNDTLPNSEFIIPERSPTAAGTGRVPSQDSIRQFPGDTATHTRSAGDASSSGEAR